MLDTISDSFQQTLQVQVFAYFLALVSKCASRDGLELGLVLPITLVTTAISQYGAVLHFQQCKQLVQRADIYILMTMTYLLSLLVLGKRVSEYSMMKEN